MDNLLNKIPPQSLEAEQAVLGSVFLDNQALLVAKEILDPGDFYREAHRKIFETMLELNSEGKAVDLITLSDELRNKGEIEGVGGVTYLSNLAETTPTAANVKYHAKIVKEKSGLRKFLQMANKIAEEVYAGGDLSLVAFTAHEAMDEIEKSSGAEGLERLEISTEELLEFASYFRETPLRDLNANFSGFAGKNLVLIGGRTDMGKTALQLTCLRKVALEEGLPAAYIGSSNHVKELIFIKLLAALCQVDYNALRRGNIPKGKMKEIVAAHKKIAQAPIFLKCVSPLDVLSVISMIRKETRTVGRFGLIILENLQDLTWPEKTKTDKERIDRVTGALREFVSDIKVPTLISSHMTRESEKGEDQRPTLADFKGSGNVEDWADIALLLHRESYHKKSADGSTEDGEIIIAKGGITTTVHAKFYGQYCYWGDA